MQREYKERKVYGVEITKDDAAATVSVFPPGTQLRVIERIGAIKCEADYLAVVAWLPDPSLRGNLFYSPHPDDSGVEAARREQVAREQFVHYIAHVHDLAVRVTAVKAAPPDPRLEDVRARIDAGEQVTIADVCVLLDCSRPTAADRLKKAGIELPLGRPRDKKNKRRDYTVVLWLAGYSVQHIQAAVTTGYITVRNWIIESGLTLERRVGRPPAYLLDPPLVVAQLMPGWKPDNLLNPHYSGSDKPATLNLDDRWEWE